MSRIPDNKKKEMDTNIAIFKQAMLTSFSYRLPTNVWKEVMLRGEDTLVKNGQVLQMTGRSLGAGVWEITRPEVAGESKIIVKGLTDAKA